MVITSCITSITVSEYRIALTCDQANIVRWTVDVRRPPSCCNWCTRGQVCQRGGSRWDLVDDRSVCFDCVQSADDGSFAPAKRRSIRRTYSDAVRSGRWPTVGPAASVVVEIFHRHLQTHCLLCPTVSGQPGRHHHTATATATGREQWRHAFVLRRVRCNIAAPAADKDTAADAVLLSFSQNHRLVPQHDYEMDAY